MAKIDFFYEFASTYSYPSAMRIDDLALDYDVEVNWRPFLLGPIFKAQGWDTSPFNLYPDKGRYMRRDLERVCEALGLPPFKMPKTFPAHSLLPARVALCFSGEMRAAFSRAVYDAEFAHGADVSDTKVIEKILKSLGEEPAKIFEKVNTQAIKDALRTETEAAQKCKIFGAPAVVTEDGELFWGNDRLEAALEWAAR
ncbi:MAG: 2-hydroxychromene-2-carboxylate isomerase [Xanthobacteraceae bacterium]|nr:2-hydroxychromene-2-carboxylate isomerase [Xanthobacteraceae bacterium]MCW5677730.1 2-hydroxychromene-2-carboxylate isomerase [Xanthobacteraceae bacterium]